MSMRAFATGFLMLLLLQLRYGSPLSSRLMPPSAMVGSSVYKSVLDLSYALCEKSYATWKSNTDGGTGMSMVGRDKEGLWVNAELLEQFEDVLRDVKVVEDSAAVQFIAAASHCLEVPLLKRADVEVTLLSVPPASAHIPRRHPAGTILLYKRLFGAINLRSVIVSGTSVRDIKSEELLEADLMRRLGGLSRVLESTNALPAAVLEVALFPPTRTDEGLAEVSPYDGALDGLMQLTLSPAMLGSLLESRAAYQAGLEAERERALTSASASSAALGQSLVGQRMEERVGGLQKEIRALVRRVLASRSLPPATLAALGLTHVRGVLLHGPPGTGKTLLARELALQLNATDETIKIVNGPDVFDKYVGEAERNVRELFVDAQKEWDLRGDKSRLHVVILDELDSIAKKRSNSPGAGSSTRDSVVNQLLAELDGVKQKQNVLVVGITNRKDLVDPAILRPGRLEVHLHITSPDLDGRREVVRILLGPMRSAGLLSEGDFQALVDSLSRQSEGFSGAELAGVARSAASFAIERAFAEASGERPARDAFSAPGADIRAAGPHSQQELASSQLRVRPEQGDFVRALTEVRAARGEPGVGRVPRALSSVGRWLRGLRES